MSIARSASVKAQLVDNDQVEQVPAEAVSADEVGRLFKETEAMFPDELDRGDC